MQLESAAPNMAVMPARPAVTAVSSSGIPPVLRWAFYAFVFLLPIESVSIGVEITGIRIIGYLFFLIALLHPGVCFRRPPWAFWCFGTFVYIYAVLGVFQGAEFWLELIDRLFTLLQLLVLFWISWNLMRYAQVAKGALLTLGVSCAMCALLQLAGLTDVRGDEERVSSFGQNPNEVAGIFSLGLLALIGLASSRDGTASRFRLLAWALFAVLGVAIIQTGSRGALLALGAGLVTFMLGGGTPRARFRNVLIVLLGIGFFAWLSYSFEASRRRWEVTLATGNTAHREALWGGAWQMILEKPLAGWGPVTHQYELGSRTTFVHWRDPNLKTREPHNLLLFVLTATGLLGTIPFLAGIWLCLRAAWKARRGFAGILPVAMMMTLLAWNISGDRIFYKIHWLVLAYGLASASQFVLLRPCLKRARFGNQPTGRESIRGYPVGNS